MTKFNPTGSLVYSTFLDAIGDNYGAGIAADGSGNAYVTGFTTSISFPTTSGAYQTAFAGGEDAFVTKLNATGSALVYSTYLGGSAGQAGSAIAVDSAGEAYVAGATTSTNFPTVNPFQATNAGGYFGIDVFVSEFNATGSVLVSSSYLGGTEDDYVSGIGVDSSGNAYVAGQTYSSNFPTTLGAFQQTAPASPCVHFPHGYIPFTSVYSVADGLILVGQMTPASFFSTFQAMRSRTAGVMTTLMRNGRDRRSENPSGPTRYLSACEVVGTDQRITSGPAATVAASRPR